ACSKTRPEGRARTNEELRLSKRGKGEMTKAPIVLQELRRRIYRKAKSEKAHRFWGIFVHVTRTETLEEAYRIAKRNGGAAGIDGQTFETIETAGWTFPRIRERSERSRFRAYAIAWCRGH